LQQHLEQDATALMGILQLAGNWNPASDAKLGALVVLLQQQHPTDKVLIFTQFADTARYLARALEDRGIGQVGLATGQSADPTALAWRFSPISNEKPIPAAEQLRVLVATDVLSEGQNLQDCAIILNYDLPWAIIRLIQRAGRVDRIGQQAEEILCYSFLPAEGVERLINLRGRLRDRLNENQEVVGTEQTKTVAGTLGNKRSAAARTYDRLMAYTQHVRETTPLLAMGTEWENLERAIEEINQYPLKQNAIARLNRELKAGISDEQSAQLVTFLREHDALCVINPEERRDGAQIICSMELFSG
jgi:superfamily II DNA/RNA helicase